MTVALCDRSLQRSCPVQCKQQALRNEPMDTTWRLSRKHTHTHTHTSDFAARRDAPILVLAAVVSASQTSAADATSSFSCHTTQRGQHVAVVAIVCMPAHTPATGAARAWPLAPSSYLIHLRRQAVNRARSRSQRLALATHVTRQFMALQTHDAQHADGTPAH